MTSIFVIITVALGLAAYMWGRRTQKVKELKKDAKTQEKEKEILEGQRDNRVVSLDDARRLFDKLRNK